MRVAVDEAGHYECAAEIDDARGLAGPRAHRLPAERCDLISYRADGVGEGSSRPAGPDTRVHIGDIEVGPSAKGGRRRSPRHTRQKFAPTEHASSSQSRS